MNDAKPLTPEEQAVLDALEPQAEPQCAVAKQTVPHAAEVALRCRSCGEAVVLVCKHHARGYAAYCLRGALQAAAHGMIFVVDCRSCHATSESLDDLVEVVHL